LAGRERRKTIRNLQTAFSKDLTLPQIEKMAESVWVRLGQNLFETVKWLNWPHEKIAAQVIRSQGWEHAQKAIDRGKGVLIVSAHLGNWELLAAALSRLHANSAVAQKIYDPRFDKIVTYFRENNLKVSMIKRGMALRGILEALKQNHLMMALCDQDTGNDGVFVPFFGKEAWTQSGVARIAYKTGAALVPIFAVRGEDGEFEMRVEPEIEVPHTGDVEKDILETVRRYTEVIESYVKAYPDQWMWMHERWKTKPKDEFQKIFG
jgi:KDO2-lipid IV(A) lauroyltransferase